MRQWAIALGAGAGLASAAAAQPAPGNVDLAAERAAIEQYQRIDQQLQNVGWKLARGNAPFCDQVMPSIGLQLHDMASYGRPDIARAALGLTGDFAVQTVASDSPAALSGAFASNREVTRLVRLDPNRLDAGERLDWRRLQRAHEHIESLLRITGAVEVGFADGQSALVQSVPVCATRFEIANEGDLAVADGERVVFGVDFPGFTYDEAVFAAGVAHELAHNLLKHADWLDTVGRKRRNVRRAEREADRLMPWLLANAGYDPRAAVVFMQTWGPRHGGGLWRKRTHDGWDERVEFIEAELPHIQALIEREGKADWRANFLRDIPPQSSKESARRD